MPGYINKSGYYDLAEFGIVQVKVKANARSVRVRWKAGAIVVSAWTSIPYDQLLDIMRSLAPRIKDSKPDTPYAPNQTLDFGELKISITTQSHAPNRIFANLHSEGQGIIEVGTDWDFESNDTIKTISKFMCRMAQNIAPRVLIPRAKDLASKVNVTPLMWTISNGHRILGHCDSKGVIALSYALIFYPQHLRDYVIYHELAHLTEMNHSPRFHAICDTYCDGHAKDLIAALKSYRPPIFK